MIDEEKTETDQSIAFDEQLRSEAEQFFNTRPNEKAHKDVLTEIHNMLQPVDFRALAELDDGEKVTQKHQRILTIQVVTQMAVELNGGLCMSHNFVYVYNGQYWKALEFAELENFLGRAASKIGVDEFTARDYEFKGKLVKQFLSEAYLPLPDRERDCVLINLQNGTFEISENGATLRDFRPGDFLTYQLPFTHDPSGLAPKWQTFLDRVLPDKSKQHVLAEYVAYVFARRLKLEKTLILFGTGANGKSVVFDVICALLGKENVSHCSLENLGQDYFRATLANKLLNYSSEMSYRLQAEKFKQLTSGEPVEARLPYGQPTTLTDYARLAFNCNELPRDVEHTEAFFRRFLIIEFDVFIPEGERNPNLAREIIETQLPGVFVWVLEGLDRLLTQQGFSRCEAAEKKLAAFRRESDSVASFLLDESYRPSTNRLPVKELYGLYKTYCIDNSYRPLGRNNFIKRLESNKITVMRANVGHVAFIERSK